MVRATTTNCSGLQSGHLSHQTEVLFKFFGNSLLIPLRRLDLAFSVQNNMGDRVTCLERSMAKRIVSVSQEEYNQNYLRNKCFVSHLLLQLAVIQTTTKKHH